MQKFKQNWEISKNWQLLYPAVGLIGLLYSAYKLSLLFSKDSLFLNIVGTIILFFILLKLTLFIFKKLENRWVVKERWQIIRIFLIFAITGMSSLYITKPIFELIGLKKGVFGNSGLQLTLFYIVEFIAVLPFYKILLLIYGWLLGEFKFFLEFTKKMLNRMGFKKSA